jgi:hypothetical protein
MIKCWFLYTLVRNAFVFHDLHYTWSQKRVFIVVTIAVRPKPELQFVYKF